MILGYEANLGLIYYGPKWSWAEMVMGRNDPDWYSFASVSFTDILGRCAVEQEKTEN